MGIRISGVRRGLNATHSDPTDGLTVASRLKRRGPGIIDCKVSDMGVPAENLNWSCWLCRADRVVDSGKRAAAALDCIVTD